MKLDRQMRDKRRRVEGDSDPLVTEHRMRVLRMREACAPLVRLAAAAQPPNLQVMSFHSAPLARGEIFDVTCFAGCAQYHALRTRGRVGPGMLSSVHIRATDFESQADASAGEHSKHTHKLHVPCMVYLATTHLAWAAEGNHERVTASSACHLQSTRADMEALEHYPIDATCDIVVVIIDTMTDSGHLHFCKEKGGEGASDTMSHVHAMDDEEDLTFSSGDPQAVMLLADQLIHRSAKDAVPHATVAAPLAAFALRCVRAGKLCHLFLVGCNTINCVLPIQRAIPADAHRSIWVMATSQVWPADLSSWLWHLYGHLGGADLTEFRLQTRMLLDEFTHHWKNQRVFDESMVAAMRGVDSLADLVHLDRMDKVYLTDGDLTVMERL